MTETAVAPAPTARTVAHGALWNYLAQIFTVLVQLGYAAATSRLLADGSFGVYGAAYASAQLINLLATAGLSQTIGRMKDLNAARLAGLLIFAGIVGVTAAGVLVATANVWAAIWGTPASAQTIRVLAAMSFLSPLIAVANGLSLRLGKFRRLAVTTFASNVFGMIVGVLAVVAFRSTESLAVSPIVGQLGVVVVVLVSSRAQFKGAPKLRETLTDIGFSFRVATSGVLSYSVGNAAKIGFSQIFGAAALGQWNRADALTTTPFYQLQNSLILAVYPEFRHDVGATERARRVWADLITMTAWITVPLGAFAAVVSPFVVTILLGHGWALAATLAPVLAVLGGLQAPMFLLVSALEAVGRFPWLWAGYILNVAAIVAGTVVGGLQHQFVWMFVGISVGAVLMHALEVALAIRGGLLDGRSLAVGYGRVGFVSIAIAGITWLLVAGAGALQSEVWLFAAGLALLVLALALVWRSRRRLWPLELARSYGLLRR